MVNKFRVYDSVKSILYGSDAINKFDIIWRDICSANGLGINPWTKGIMNLSTTLRIFESHTNQYFKNKLSYLLIDF